MTENPTILVTGATGRLGSQVVMGFAALGYTLILPIRAPEAAKELAMNCKTSGAKEVIIIQSDLTCEKAARDIQIELHERALFPTILVNNARNVEYLKSEADGIMGRKNWLNEFLLDVVVPYELTMSLVEVRHSKLKKVINVSSIYGITAPNINLYEQATMSPPINYGVAKSALIHLTKELAVRLATKGVEVNSVSYGGVAGRVEEKFKQAYGRLCPSGRMLSDQDIFGPIRFLASNESSGMTGHNLVVDGGWTIW